MQLNRLMTIVLYFICAQITHAATQPPISITPVTSPIIQNTDSGKTIINYTVTNQLKNTYTFVMMPIAGVKQITSKGNCQYAMRIASKGSCTLSLSIDRRKLKLYKGQPRICLINGETETTYCAPPSPTDVLRVDTVDPNFPYGSAPVGNVCVSSDYYATPETMLGSWAMLNAVAMDQVGHVLPSFMTTSNAVYAVGTAAIGDALGIPNCSGGCNQLNGYCFALKFNGKNNYPYMILQSVNIGANNNSFDIYMAGGGSGAFPAQCQQFWGTDSNVNWANHIQDSSCAVYFNNYSSINSQYSVTYDGVAHPAKETLENACTFASAGQSGFNTQNWNNVSVVPVTCPQSLVQISGVEIPATVTTIGNQTIRNLSTLTDNDFTTTSITGITTTQMQDCKTPSSGYCNNVPVSVPNYQASISTSLSDPLLTGAPPSNTYCQSNPNTKYCSWNDGDSSGGGSYCNANASQCISCGNGSKWCTCVGDVLIGCSSTPSK